MLAVMGCPGRCWLSVSIFHAQGNDKKDTLYQDKRDNLYQSGYIREVAWSMEGTTKQVENI